VNTSRARFEEGVEQVRRLLEEERVASQGQFHSFPETTSLPRPTQRPRPPFWVAALGTPQSFIEAGQAGHWVMAIPLAGGKMKELLAMYREAWRGAGHPGNGKVMLAFHMYCAPTRAEAEAIAREPLNRYLKFNTFDFQAPQFYRKLGYSVFGELEGGDDAAGQVFLRKRLPQP